MLLNKMPKNSKSITKLYNCFLIKEINYMKRILFLVILIFTRLLIDVQVVSAQLSSQTQVSSDNQQIMRTLNYLYESGKEGYNTFRIPAVVTTGKGIILAFAEGRKNSGSDTGDIDLVMKSSEDNGKTWKLGGSTPQDQVNECTVAELPDGRLILNMRNYDRSRTAREISISNDGGLSWGDIHPEPVLVEPLCQASILRYSDIKSRKSKLLFLNPGPSAYSDLTKQKDGKIGCCFEAGLTFPY